MSVEDSVDDPEVPGADSCLELPRLWVPSLCLAGSVLLHLCLLGVLAAALLPGLTSRAGVSIVISQVDTVLPDDIGFEPALELPGGSSGDAPEQAGLEMNFTGAELSESDFAAAPLQTDGNFAVALSNAGISDSLIESVGGGGSGSSPGTGSGSGTGTGSGSGDGAGSGNGRRRFFNIDTSGKSAVFVVDASRSMNMPHPGPLRTRFNRVKFELLRTISSMGEDEQFFIIFFGDDAIPMPARALVSGSLDSKHRYLHWMAQIPADGHTFPRNALLQALSLQPDAIYFLTDGEFESGVVPGVTAANPGGIPIHTIGFNDRRGENLLMEIAQKNNGTYTYISENEADAEETDPAPKKKKKSGKKTAAVVSSLSTP
jgi:hypothetical protein